MPKKTLYRVLLPVVVLGLTLTAVAVATGATASKTPKKATIRAEGKLEFKPNKFFKEAFHYRGHKVPIKSGGTITLVDKIGQDHTFSLVKRSSQPKTIKQANACFEGPGVCGQILGAHGASETGPPT